ncbi:MAG TPA: aromatic aminobenezylarsenical efflux permease ArsG family transporter [Candidatus Omnitrophota bacterium]|nr:aromatic aminobenezylarsenical efflux permease ArsG family transporter [Candidatus Omnitrophota bacterium]HPT39133.1 aromatic aminobenezylarsenical efflux permease ArsG family transporter [Candidatus Omnitrophota bacterium]
MTEIFIGSASALWLGILTSISPCPLASNVAAISFLSKKITHPALVFISGLAYTLGRMVSYAILGWIIISSLLSVPQVAQFLQRYMGKALGPLLILTGLVVLEIITIRLPGLSLSQKHSSKLAEAGAPGAFLLGFIFALAFCPVSAALFFGSLIPLALNSKTGTLLPLIYGVGTGLPVFLFAAAIALGVTSLSGWFHGITKLEYYAGRITGGIFILAGLYYTGSYILKLF